MISRTCVLVRLTISCAGKLIVTTGEIEVGGCMLRYCTGFGAGTSSYTLTIFYSLEGAVLDCSGNREDDV